MNYQPGNFLCVTMCDVILVVCCPFLHSVFPCQPCVSELTDASPLLFDCQHSAVQSLAWMLTRFVVCNWVGIPSVDGQAWLGFHYCHMH